MKTVLLSLSGAVFVCSGLAQNISVPEMPHDQHRALMIQEENWQRESPALDYWGYKEFEWGSSSNLVANRNHGQLSVMKTTQLFGLNCIRLLEFEKDSNLLVRVRFSFSEGITNRAARLRDYQTIKSKLMDAYNAPSHSVKPDKQIRGHDAYFSGIDKEYRLEWRGPETVVALILSDEYLHVIYSQASRSKASDRKEQVSQGVAHQARVKAILERAFHGETTKQK